MPPKRKINIEEEISRCINQLLMAEPFYAHILAGTVRTITNEINTAAVGIRNQLIQLMINESFFLNVLSNLSERTAVLKHEVLHLVFRHLFRDKITEDPELFNIAADLVVNQYIGSWKLPENTITLKTFNDLNLKPEQTLEYYYEQLLKLKNDHNQASKYPISAKALKDINNQQINGDHSFWVNKTIDGRISGGKIIDETTISASKYALNKRLTDAFQRIPSKFYGSLPANIITTIELINDEMKPKVDWKTVLKIFSSACGRTQIYHTTKRISKRYGTRPGIRIKKIKKMAVIIDTSASIEPDILKQFFKEIDSMHLSGAEITVVECDAEVGRVYPYKKDLQIIDVSGGGGTQYDPAFKYINEKRNSSIDGIIYLTDGYAPEPKIKPKQKLLYVITPEGKPGPHLKWGKSLIIKK
jgi:predicted metal-dependent peptidase